MEADVPLLELIATGSEFNVRVAPFYSNKEKRVVTVVDGNERDIKIYFDSVKKRYNASGLRPYDGVRPNFSNFAKVAQAEGLAQFALMLHEIAEEFKKLPEELGKELDKNIEGFDKKIEKTIKKVESTVERTS